MKKCAALLNKNQIKALFVIAMIIDHIAIAFIEQNTIAYEISRGIGRLAGPGMSYCLAEGFCNTSNIDKYTKRLGIFAIISTPPYLLFGLFTDAVGKTKLHDIAVSLFPFLSVIYTLLMAMLFLRIYTNQHVSQAKKYALMSLTIIASYLGDWGMYGIMFVWCFYEFRNNERIKWALYLMISTIYILNIKKWFAAGVLLFPLVILLYNGKRGRKNVISTWGFYVIYPIHFLILVLFKTMFCK